MKKRLIFKPTVSFILPLLICVIASDGMAQINHIILNDTLTGPDTLMVDLDSDEQTDFRFEILELMPDVYGARTVTQNGSQFLDNSTFGYLDTLNFGDTIQGNFNMGNGVLGTFNDAGQFRGAGDKYFGIIFNGLRGWIQVNCNFTNDTLIIIDAGYQTEPGAGINAGQTEIIVSSNFEEKPGFKLFPNPASESLHVEWGNPVSNLPYVLYSLSGKAVAEGRLKEKIEISHIPEGLYFLSIRTMGNTWSRKVLISR